MVFALLPHGGKAKRWRKQRVAQFRPATDMEGRLRQKNQVFSSSTQRTAWSIAARHLAAGQKDPVKMIAEAIEHERHRCIELLLAARGQSAEIPVYLIDPDLDW